MIWSASVLMTRLALCVTMMTGRLALAAMNSATSSSNADLGSRFSSGYLGEHDRRTAPVRAERAPQVAKRRWNIPARPLRAVAQRVEVVSPSEIRILGTKTELLRTLVATAGVESAAAGVRSFIPKWRARRDSNSRPPDS